MMKTIPSLVASSTVGIAPVGLAFGKPERSTPPRPSSKKRKVGDFAEVVIHNQRASPLGSRPGTSSTAITLDTKAARPATSSISNPTPTLRARASTIRVEAQHNSGRRHSIFKHDEVPLGREHSEEDTRRESISSRGSWIRRLSIIPNSRDNSPRSSLGPDSPSFSIFNGSAAPILSSPANSPAQLPPNKLVKRGSTIRQHSGPASTSWTGSKSQVPTLRRPATSHQRSITLQQQFRDNSMSPQDGLQQVLHPQPRSTPVKKISTPESRHAWRLYFDSRPTKLTKDKPSARASDEGTKTSPSSSKRVMPDENARPTLVTPDMITAGQAGSTAYYYDDSIELDETMDDEIEVADAQAVQLISSSTDANKRPRRSLSMHFSSPSSWISRSASLRGNKRNPDGRSGGKRFASAPLPSTFGEGDTPAHDIINHKTPPTMDPGVLQRENKQKSLPGASVEGSFQPRGRTSSSPLPPLSRFSTFNMRSELSVLPTTATTTGNTSLSSTGHTSPSSVLNFDTRQPKPHRVSEVGDRASTLIGSDNEAKGFVSGDEEDMDFQSETVYDSLRSGATGSLRSQNAQLDLMFEESPPSVTGHTKTKRLSIHEMLNNGGFSEGTNRIVEEDEGMSTPVKNGRVSQERSYQTPVRMDALEMDEAFPSSPPSFCLATKDFGRLSLDDEDEEEEEEEEDWTRDDENGDMSGQLSPPSSTVNSRKVSPSIRAALADVTHSGSTNDNPLAADRPRSNLFDWSEPPAEKDYMGNSSRPRTAHVKHIADIRGGRTVGRKGPTALHIRSQSVPVVPDVAGQRDHSKLAPKFGTWGLGAKGVSEDWDNDFEFENDSNDETPDGENKLENSGMFVPKAIQASQASVVGHVGQIREVCLLVEDLKRLRLLAREKGILNGPLAHLWKEAEGIIALAVPDEEDPTLSPPGSPSSTMFEREVSDDGYHERGISVEDLEMPDAPFEVLNRHGKSTGFVSDGRTVRRRSVFSGDDDIFGSGTIDMAAARDHLQPPSSMKTSSEIARSVMETMHQHRSTSDPLLQKMINQSPNKMPFDTTSLRDLVNRASNLSRALAELIRKADGGSESPEMNGHRDSSPAFTRVFSDPPGSSRGLDNNTHRDSSPAFTRVFDASASSPNNLSRSHSNNPMLSGSIDNSPTRLGQRLHMMTVV